MIEAEKRAHALDFFEASETLPDLVLLELMTPVMKGFELREISKERGLPSILSRGRCQLAKLARATR